MNEENKLNPNALQLHRILSLCYEGRKITITPKHGEFIRGEDELWITVEGVGGCIIAADTPDPRKCQYWVSSVLDAIGEPRMIKVRTNDRRK